MIKEVVKLVENSDEKKVAAVFSKFKEMALDHELKEIAKAIGAQKYGLPEDKDELFDIISEKIGYKTPTRKIKNDKAEVETKIIVKEEELRAVNWNWNPARIIDQMIAMPYTFAQAVSDVIDNSIDAGAQNIDIYQNMEEKTRKRYVIIQDDAKGMTEKELHEQIGLGASREYKEHELGKFGSGLKLSSLSQAREVSVFSKTNKNKDIAYRRISANHVSKTKKMELLTNKLSSAGHAEALERLNLSDSGTIVLWEEMDKKPWRLEIKT